jgi:voltage-gated potassium channel
VLFVLKQKPESREDLPLGLPTLALLQALKIVIGGGDSGFMKNRNLVKARVALWQSKSDLPLALLGLAYLAVYSIQVVYREHVQIVRVFDVVADGIWIVFALDLVLRFFTRQSFGKFLKSNWLEIFALALPFMRFLRVFRVVLALRNIKGLLSSRSSAAGAYLVLLLPLTWFSGALAVLDAESTSSEASITTLRDAMWWSLSTITTVGYGDKYPITVEGQLLAGVLMVTGISLFSAVAGVFAGWILQEKRTV